MLEEALFDQKEPRNEELIKSWFLSQFIICLKCIYWLYFFISKIYRGMRKKLIINIIKIKNNILKYYLFIS